MGLHRLAVRIEPDAIVFDRVPYRASVHHPRVRLAPGDLVEVGMNWFPPYVLTRAGEFLPVSAELKPELVAFAQAHGVPLVNREDVWSALLEPFLDTELSPGLEKSNLAMLASVGLDAAHVAALRQRVGRRMDMLTMATWEWMHYGLTDVLDAMEQLNWPGAFRRFYTEAMAIAARGGTWPYAPPSPADLTEL